MAGNVKISELPAAAALDGTEEVPVVQSASTVKATSQDIADLAAHTSLTDMPDTLATNTDHDVALAQEVGTVAPTVGKLGKIFFDTSISPGLLTGKIVVVTKTANFTVSNAAAITLVRVDATTGDITITLFTAVGNKGKQVWVKKVDSSANNRITDADGTETMDGDLTRTDNAQYFVEKYMSNGTNWDVV